LIVIALIVALVVWLVRRALREKRGGARPAAASEDLVRCAHCGVHLPRADAVLVDTQAYCGPAHARLGRGPG
jgi:uncharacterized protein